MEYEMTLEELQAMYAISASWQWVMKFWDYWTGMDTQERANSFWKTLWEKYQFDWNTVRPIHWKWHRFFSANPITH